MTKVVKYIFSLFVIIGITEARSFEDYLNKRKELIEAEKESFLGAEIELTANEALFNDLLMQRKRTELESSFQSANFLPAVPFYNVKYQIEQSDVFQMIKILPKGSVLHVHDFSITSIDWIINNVTYRDHLWICQNEVQDVPIKFGWFVQAPMRSPECAWTLLKAEREIFGANYIDDLLLEHLTIITDTPELDYPNINAVWSKFQNIFGSLMSLLSYEPVARDYFYQGFKEFMRDGVQYFEFRTVLPSLCQNMFNRKSGNCENPTTPLETAMIMKEVAEQFLDENDFCGVRMIYAPSRFVQENTIAEYFKILKQLQENLGDFVAGFDLVGQEDKGKPLINFAPEILQHLESHPNLKMFYHAGETDWQGQETDLNLFDALLLNTSRIGHGYAIVKHPVAKEIAIEREVALEVSPISNQVLKLVDDLRNHPATILIQENFPIVISADDPGIWGAEGLSYDFYEAFMAMSSKDMDLRLLKKFALNSIKYTTLNQSSKDKCFAMFNTKWNSLMDDINNYLHPTIVQIE